MQSSSSGDGDMLGFAAATAHSIPLTAHRGLAIAYLEALNGEGFASAESQDELGRLLIEGMVEESGKLFGGLRILAGESKVLTVMSFGWQFPL